MVTRNRKETLKFETLIEAANTDAEKREKDYLQKQFDSYKEFKYHFKNNDSKLSKLTRSNEEHKLKIESLTLDLKASLDTTKINKLSITKIK